MTKYMYTVILYIIDEFNEQDEHSQRPRWINSCHFQNKSLDDNEHYGQLILAKNTYINMIKQG